MPHAPPSAPPATIKDTEITYRRNVVSLEIAPEVDAVGHLQEFGLFINGNDDPTRIGHRVQWTIVNAHKHDDHVFHIHTDPFQLVSVNGKALAMQGVAGFCDRGEERPGRVSISPASSCSTTR